MEILKYIKKHIKIIIKAIILAFILYAIYWIGFFRGEIQSPNAYNRGRIDATERSYIHCMEKLEAKNLKK